MNSSSIETKESISLNGAILKLRAYIEDNEYKGYDPYDGLSSPLFKLPILKSTRLLRFFFQQFIKRFPFNLRPLLSIEKGLNPVTLGLSVQAYSYLYEKDKNNQKYYLDKIEFLIGKLESLIPKGYAGACWGYDFDWEARYINVPAFQPTIVATGIISNALYVTHLITKNQKAYDLLISCGHFLKNDINRTYEDKKICFSYSPFDNEKVFNASMKGARLLSQVYDLTKDQESLYLAKNATDFVINYQNSDGSWKYGLAKKGEWIDSYHTGYILDCLKEYQDLTNDDSYEKNLNEGYRFFKKSFITSSGTPKFYNNHIYPIDCTSAAQLITTLGRFGDKELASKVAKWMILNMQKKNGGFKFRSYKYYNINTSYMRWSNAWMFKALAYLR